MTVDKDDFVEKLVKGLPKAGEMSEFELKRFEKLIDNEISAMKKSSSPRNFTQKLSVAASVVAIFIAVGIFATQNDFFTTDGGGLPISSPNGKNDSGGSANGDSNNNSGTKNTENPSSNKGEMFGNDNSPENEVSEVPVFNTGTDYKSDFSGAMKIVKLSSSPLEISSLTSKQRNCAIALGIDSELLAIDSGFYDSELITAFFVGKNKTEYAVQIVSSSCELITEIKGK